MALKVQGRDFKTASRELCLFIRDRDPGFAAAAKGTLTQTDNIATLSYEVERGGKMRQSHHDAIRIDGKWLCTPNLIKCIVYNSPLPLKRCTSPNKPEYAYSNGSKRRRAENPD